MKAPRLWSYNAQCFLPDINKHCLIFAPNLNEARYCLYDFMGYGAPYASTVNLIPSGEVFRAYSLPDLFAKGITHLVTMTTEMNKHVVYSKKSHKRNMLIVKARYAKDGDILESYHNIGVVFDLTRSRVWQIVKKVKRNFLFQMSLNWPETLAMIYTDSELPGA